MSYREGVLPPTPPRAPECLKLPSETSLGTLAVTWGVSLLHYIDGVKDEEDQQPLHCAARLGHESQFKLWGDEEDPDLDPMRTATTEGCAKCHNEGDLSMNQQHSLFRVPHCPQDKHIMVIQEVPPV